MIRQSSSAGPPCKYLHNYAKKNVKFLQKKERKKREDTSLGELFPLNNQRTLFSFFEWFQGKQNQ